jgi:UDP-glucose 4-epimerase
MADLAGTRVLVTGGAGFVGTALVRRLLAAGCDVAVADSRPSPLEGVESVVGDLRDGDVLDRALGADAAGVIHLAAATSVLGSMNDPWGTYEHNVRVTASLLELARTRGVERFLMSSTNAVVGDVGRRVIDESLPLRPLTPYGSTKAAAEMLLAGYSGSYAMATCALRFTNVYGPGMHGKDSIVARLMRAARSGATIEIYGDGKQLRDFVYVDDVVEGMLLAWRSNLTGPLVIGSGRSVSVLELVELARQATGRPIAVEHVAARVGEMEAVIVDISAARRHGFECAVPLEQGLAAVWEDVIARWDDASP